MDGGRRRAPFKAVVKAGVLRLPHRCAVGAFIFRRASQISFARGGGIKPRYPDGPVSLQGLRGLVLPSAGFPGRHGAAAEASETPPNAPCQAGPPAWLSLVGSRESRPLLPPSASGLTPGPGEVARTPRPTLHLPFVGLPRPRGTEKGRRPVFHACPPVPATSFPPRARPLATACGAPSG